MRDARTLYVIVRDQQGRVAHTAIGCAMVEADLTIFALRKGIEPLTSFYADSPAQAEEAKRALGDLGDVEFDDHDFDPQWFEPLQGIAATDDLLEHGRKGKCALSEPVRAELGLLRRALAEARLRSCQFYLVEVDADEGLDFAGVEFKA